MSSEVHDTHLLVTSKTHQSIPKTLAWFLLFAPWCAAPFPTHMTPMPRVPQASCPPDLLHPTWATVNTQCAPRNMLYMAKVARRSHEKEVEMTRKWEKKQQALGNPKRPQVVLDLRHSLRCVIQPK